MGLKRIIARLFSKVPVNREAPALWVALCLVPEDDKLLMLGVYSTKDLVDHSCEQFVPLALDVAATMGLSQGDSFDLKFFDWNSSVAAMVSVRTWLVGYSVPAEHAVEFARSIDNDLMLGDY